MNWTTAVIWAADSEPEKAGMARRPLVMAVVNWAGVRVVAQVAGGAAPWQATQ